MPSQIRASPGFEPGSFMTQHLAQRYTSTSITPALHPLERMRYWCISALASRCTQGTQERGVMLCLQCNSELTASMYIFYKVLQAFFDHYCDQVMRDLPILQIQTSPIFEPRSFTTQRLAQRYASTSVTPALHPLQCLQNFIKKYTCSQLIQMCI